MPVSQRIEIQFRTSLAFKSAYTEYLSKGLFYFVAHWQIVVSEHLALQFRVPSVAGALETEAMVMHVHDLGGTKWGVGIELCQMSDKMKSQMRLAHEQLDDGLDSAAESVFVKKLPLVVNKKDGVAAHHAQQAKKIFTQARELIVRGNLRAALRKVQEALELDPTEPQYRAVLRELRSKLK